MCQRTATHLAPKQEITPEKGPWLCGGLQLQISGDCTEGINRVGTRSIAREHHIKIGEVALLQAFVEVFDLLG